MTCDGSKRINTSPESPVCCGLEMKSARARSRRSPSPPQSRRSTPRNGPTSCRAYRRHSSATHGGLSLVTPAPIPLRVSPPKALMATPTRRASSRSAPSTARSSKSQPRNAPPSSPLAHAGGDILIDPALLAEDEALQDDLDAEGEVDDGVGYYLPVRCFCFRYLIGNFADHSRRRMITSIHNKRPTRIRHRLCPE